MRVVEISTQEQKRCYVVIDEAGQLIEPIVRYLKYLDRTGAARLTLRSYAFALKQYWAFLVQEQLDWQQITLDDFSQFILWLKLPTSSLNVLPMHPVPQARSHRTINHALTVVTNFYDYHWRMDAISSNVKGTTTTYLPARARRYKSFLHHLSNGAPVAKNMLKQNEKKRKRPKTIAQEQVQQLMDACTNQRDRLLIRLLYESAIRVGELLALWVEDIDVAENRIHIQDRGPLENGAEIKTVHAQRALEVSSDLIDEIIAYVGKAHTAAVETNHLFLKLQGEHASQAMTYAEVDSLFRRLRKRTSIEVTPHVLRHTMLTKLAELGWQPEHLRERAGHASFQQTYQTYIHPSQEALRDAWEQTQDRIALSPSSGGQENA